MRASSTDTTLRIPRISRALRAAAVIILIAIPSVIVQQQMAQHDRILMENRQELGRLAMVFAEQTGRAVETAEVILHDLAEEHGGPAQLGANVVESLRRHIDGLRQVHDMQLVDAAGLIRATTIAGAGGRLAPEGLDLLERLRQRNEPGLLFSAPLRAPDGAWVVLVGVRVVDAAGRFDGAMLAGLKLGYFEDFYRSVDLGEGGTIMLHRRDGVVLAAFPGAEGLIGTSYATRSPFRDVLREALAGSAMITDGPDSGRLVAARALKNFPLAVSLTVATDTVLAGWRRQTAIALLAALLVAGTIGGLLLMLAAESRRVERLLADNTRARDAAEAVSARLTRQIEERERTEAALRQAQRLEAIGQLTGGVAHDFNNLLTVLLGNIELIQAGAPADPYLAAAVARTRLERMRTAAERGATLTNQLLAFARRQPLLPRPASLNSTIRGMLDLIRSAVGSNIEIALTLEPALWSVLVDTAQMELVILNLALNARDAMPNGGRLAIETVNVTPAPIASTGPDIETPMGEHVVVRVRDAGEGMSEEVRARAFEPFFTTKAPGVGSGMGLSQVYGVVRQSGGGVRIDSAPGAGTTITVMLPRSEAEPDPARRPETTVISSGARVLLVDDDAAVRTTTGLILEAAGYVIFQADGAPQALRMIEAGTPIDLMLTDVAMPGMNGAELADRVRELRPNLPIVFISGYADPNAIAGREVLLPLVRKPFRVTELTSEIEVALAG